VRAQVRAQIKVQREALVAQRALEGLLPRVHQLVTLQLRVVEEAFVAALDGAGVLALAVRH
jgi:hypothetical protein